MYSNITHLDTNLDGIWYRLLAYKFEFYAVTCKQKDILLISDCETIPIENGVLFMNSLNSCRTSLKSIFKFNYRIHHIHVCVENHSLKTIEISIK